MNKKFQEMHFKHFFYENHQYLFILRMSHYIMRRNVNNGDTIKVGDFTEWSGTINKISMLYVLGNVCENDRPKSTTVTNVNYGDHCQKSSSASTTVTFLCGFANKIVGISEITLYSYDIKFESPLACNGIEDFQDEESDRRIPSDPTGKPRRSDEFRQESDNFR
jgi:hypothetical protein